MTETPPPQDDPSNSTLTGPPMDEDMVVIPLPTHGGGVTYGVARLIESHGKVFAEAIAPVPDTTFAPPRRVELSRYSLGRVRSGSLASPDLYVYEGMILPAPQPPLPKPPLPKPSAPKPKA